MGLKLSIGCDIREKPCWTVSVPIFASVPILAYKRYIYSVKYHLLVFFTCNR